MEGGRGWVAQQAQFQVGLNSSLLLLLHLLLQLLLLHLLLPLQAGLWEVSAFLASEGEADTTSGLNQMIQTMQEVTKFQNVLIDQANKCVAKNLTVFLREDMKQMKETKGYFNKISNDLDSALSKNAAVSKSRPGDLEDASNLLTATR